MCNVENYIKPLCVEEMESKQCYFASPQSHLKLDGELTIPRKLQFHEMVAPIYMTFCIIKYKSAIDVIDYYKEPRNINIYDPIFYW